MKKCPQCSTIYDDAVAFCLNDGTALIEESFSPPAEDAEDEPETIVRHDPIVIDFTESPAPAPGANQPLTPAENIVIVPADAAAVTRNYAMFLVLGLLIGGGLVLATLWFSKNLYRTENVNAGKTNTGYNAQIENEAVKTETPVRTPETTNTDIAVEPVAGKHSEANESFDGTANGRVIVLNARIRLAPDIHAPVVDTLPLDDRLDIIRRENPNSPWYQVECEHGASGWMHGDTIEFTR